MVKGALQEQLKWSLNNPSLSQEALGSHGSLRQGSGTGGQHLQLVSTLDSYVLSLLEQLNPSPSVKGDLQVQLNRSLSKLSLAQSALMSHGPGRHGSGTTGGMQDCIY